MSGKRLISYRYTMLRAATAAGTLGTGILQTFVFARVLTPERFSLFIFFAALGYTLYLTRRRHGEGAVRQSAQPVSARASPSA